MVCYTYVSQLLYVAGYTVCIWLSTDLATTASTTVTSTTTAVPADAMSKFTSVDVTKLAS